MRLQEFQNNRDHFQLNAIDKYVCEFSQDRDGSKFIQRKLDDATDNRKNKIFEEIHSNLHALMIHRFANFVVQKFFTIGTPHQCSILYKHVKENFVDLSLNKYGCRVVQKAIETATPFQFACLLEQMTERNVMYLVLDANGNHVIQNIFRTAINNNRHIQVKSPHSRAHLNHLVLFSIYFYFVYEQDVIFDRIKTHVMEMCYHLYGCRIIQCVLQHGIGTHRNHIFDVIWENPRSVMLNRYGNYVVQHLASMCACSFTPF